MRNKAAREAIKAKKSLKLQELRQKALEEERKPLSAAIKQTVIGHSDIRRHHHHLLPCHAPWSGVVNTRLKSNEKPPVSSQFCKFIGIADAPITSSANLVSNFVKLYNRQNPGMGKGDDFVEHGRNYWDQRDVQGALQLIGTSTLREFRYFLCFSWSHVRGIRYRVRTCRFSVTVIVALTLHMSYAFLMVL
ncbi:uncharacterized protein LOC130014889 [Mercurialis annua]|uniref:uncharacterized protein LOC130014889 n=1 Tax=Mercurialis annua TaxID=3986 RepID=UPI0024AF60F2|nr:uncharacterized protein LOC130014889 [Mercurialis annua]